MKPIEETLTDFETLELVQDAGIDAYALASMFGTDIDGLIAAINYVAPEQPARRGRQPVDFMGFAIDGEPQPRLPVAPAAPRLRRPPVGEEQRMWRFGLPRTPASALR
jgi:hypothetical protein